MRLIRRTSRLTIRPLRESDYSAWRQAYLSGGPAKSIFDISQKKLADLSVRAFRKKLTREERLQLADKFFTLSIFKRTSGEYMGNVALMDISRGIFHNAYLGYWLFNKYWGQGYAREAVDASINIAFRELRLHRVEAGMHARNSRSIMLARRLGMRFEGISKRRLFTLGRWSNMHIYALTREDRGLKPMRVAGERNR